MDHVSHSRRHEPMTAFMGEGQKVVPEYQNLSTSKSYMNLGGENK